MILHTGGSGRSHVNPGILNLFPAEASYASSEAWTHLGTPFHYSPSKEEFDLWGVEGICLQLASEGCAVQVIDPVLTKGYMWRTFWQDQFPHWIPENFLMNPEAETQQGIFDGMADPFCLRIEGEEEGVPEVVGVWEGGFIVHKRGSDLEVEGEFQRDSKFLFWVEIRGHRVTDILLKFPWRKRMEFLEANWKDILGYKLAHWSPSPPGGEPPKTPGTWLFKSGIGLYRCGQNQCHYFSSLVVHSGGSSIAGGGGEGGLV